MPSKKPGTPGKMRKFEEDRQKYRQEALDCLGKLEVQDLTGMFGMLAGELVARRRESELDIIRCERFHPDDLENLERHQKQAEAYSRRLLAAGAIVRLLNVFGGGESLMSALIAWADSTSQAIDFEGK